MGIIKIYHDKKWTLQFLDALYNSIDIDIDDCPLYAKATNASECYFVQTAITKTAIANQCIFSFSK
jgi:hypothetical protein